MAMKISIYVGGAAGKDIKTASEVVQAADSMGVDCVWSAEAWAQDAITTLAYSSCEDGTHPSWYRHYADQRPRPSDDSDDRAFTQ